MKIGDLIIHKIDNRIGIIIEDSKNIDNLYKVRFIKKDDREGIFLDYYCYDFELEPKID